MPRLLLLLEIVTLMIHGYRIPSNRNTRSHTALWDSSTDSNDLSEYRVETLNLEENQHQFVQWSKKIRKTMAILTLIPALLGGGVISRADDELAKYAAEGNSVGVDGSCFLKKCAIETSQCASDLSCLKGLRCLARCKGGSMCSTGCFAKFGSSRLDGLLACSVEKNDCVHVPGKENAGWNTDQLEDLPSVPIAPFVAASLKGTWYKVMGLDSRYDCFDCQKNSFKVRKSTDGVSKLEMEAFFRIPRPNYPGYLQNKIEEELQVTTWNGLSTMRSQGEMFGLTFWENWYVLGDSMQPSFQDKSTLSGLLEFPTKLKNRYLEISNDAGDHQSNNVPTTTLSVEKGNGVKDLVNDFGVAAVKTLIQGDNPSRGGKTTKTPIPDMKLIYYTGHTLQGSYKGAFLYSRSPKITSDQDMQTAAQLIRDAGLNINDFCIIKNSCFEKNRSDRQNKPAAGAKMVAGLFSGQGPGIWSGTGSGSGTASGTASSNKPIEKYKSEMGSRSGTGTETGTEKVFFGTGSTETELPPHAPFWFIGQNFFRMTTSVAEELADWFEDPEILSEWLVSQQEKMIRNQPLAVSPFASLPEEMMMFEDTSGSPKYT